MAGPVLRPYCDGAVVEFSPDKGKVFYFPQVYVRFPLVADGTFPLEARSRYGAGPRFFPQIVVTFFVNSLFFLWCSFAVLGSLLPLSLRPDGGNLWLLSFVAMGSRYDLHPVFSGLAHVKSLFPLPISFVCCPPCKT